MPTLPVQDFTTLVRNMAAAMRAASATALDFTTGTILRALIEANASIALWLQWLMLEVLATTRASTSNGPDLDTWMADFGLARLPPVPATVVVAFSRITPGLAATIPVGASVRTIDGATSFTVTADPANPAWTGAAYSLAASAFSLSLPATADAPGPAGNVPAAALRVLATAVPGIDAVTNALGATGGLAAEDDPSLRARFAGFIDSRSRATRIAIAYAVQSLRQGLRFVIQENVLPDGTGRLGTTTVTIDDGTGAPPPDLLAAAAAAVEAVRPLGSVVAVQPPATLRADIVLGLALAAPAALASVAGPVASAVSAWIAALPIGAALPRSRLVQLAFAAAPAASDVAVVTLNGASQDLVPGPTTVIVPGMITVEAV